MIETKTRKSIGVVLWQGKSLIDNERIMLVATGILDSTTANRKTGDMIQTYILRRDMHPMFARRLGEDKSICGDCKHKEYSTCYVNLCHGPIAVFKAFHDGAYRPWQAEDISLFQDRYVRFGTYGDPAAVPFEVWETIAKASKGYTGYTHQWKKCDQRLQKYCMASVDSIKGFNKEFFQAQLMGWRTFRVRENLENELLDNEFVCPASKEAGVKTNCEHCRACSGTSSKTNKNPVIMLHVGMESMGMRQKYIQIMKKIRDKKKYRRDYDAERKEFKKICTY